MKCPACTANMSERVVSDIALDVCDKGCGGIWFDKKEFEKFDEENEPNAEEIISVKASGKTTVTPPYSCPRCAPVKLFRHFSSVKRQVTIDSCPKCTGIWLDMGELSNIRQEFRTEGSRRQAADEVFDEMFGKDVKQAHDQAALQRKNHRLA